jgi:hypothetical protein
VVWEVVKEEERVGRKRGWGWTVEEGVNWEEGEEKESDEVKEVEEEEEVRDSSEEISEEASGERKGGDGDDWSTKWDKGEEPRDKEEGWTGVWWLGVLYPAA